TNVMVQFTITGPSGYNYTDTQSIASIIPNQVVTVVFAMAPTFSSAGAYSMTAQVVTPDCLAMNDSINGAFQVSNPIGGNVTVGTGGTYPSLTNAGGVFEAINGGGLFGNLTINVVSDLTSETGAVGLNQWSETGAGNYTVTIRPSGAARSITGSTASTGLVRFVGASRVTIDGSVGGGGSDRSLTIENTNTTGPIVVLFGSVGSTPISNDTLKNCTIRNGANTSSAVVTSDAGTPGNPGFFTNVTIQNNSIQKAYIGAYSNGGAAPTQGGSNLSYLDNDLTSSGANAIRDVGLYMQGVNGATVSRNSIGKLDTTNDEDDRGIWAASGTTNAVISRNTITGIGYTGTAGFGAHGIAVSTGTANANVVISNNMISNITGDGFDVASFPADNPYGMYISGTQSGIKIYYNSINLFGNTLNQTGALSAGIVIGTGTTAVDLANNVVTNNLGLSAASGTGAVGIWLQTAATQLSSAMNNDYLVNPSGGGTKNIGRISATNSATLANWQAATGKETNSISADPLFSASTNLHINCGSPVIALGVPIGGLTTDFDGQTRDAVPEIGADELVAPTPSSAVSRFIHTGFGAFDVNLPGIECRSNGPAGNYQVIFNFAAPITFGSAAVTSGTGMTTTTSGSGTNAITVNLTGVNNAQYLTVSLLCATDGVNIGDVSTTMGVLIGDLNTDTFVNAADATIARNLSGQVPSATVFRADVNLDGFINSADATLVRNRSGSGL
ncbi:MAG: beta strand repeat-containing protein, partial [Chthoniobacterales bacterium]